MGKKFTAVLALVSLIGMSSEAEALKKDLSSLLLAEGTSSRKLFNESRKASREEFLRLLYPSFPYYDEIPKIVEHTRIVGLEPELLMAIRLAENGEDSVAYGVLPAGRLKKEYNEDLGYIKEGEFCIYQNEKEKQLRWAAKTVKYYLDSFKENSKNKDFISYLAKRYSPIDAKNPHDLNRNWERNVKRLYREFKGLL